jgi:hypothetical protein
MGSALGYSSCRSLNIWSKLARLSGAGDCMVMGVNYGMILFSFIENPSVSTRTKNNNKNNISSRIDSYRYIVINTILMDNYSP